MMTHRLIPTLFRFIKSNEPVQEILALIVLAINMHSQLSSGDIGLSFGLNLYLHSYFLCANSEGSGEPVPCNKYTNPTNELRCLTTNGHLGEKNQWWIPPRPRFKYPMKMK